MRSGLSGLLAAILLLSLCLTACSPASRVEDFAYAGGEIKAMVYGTMTRVTSDGYSGSPAIPGESVTGRPLSVAAAVMLGAPTQEGGRLLTVSFSEPTALAGLTVKGRLCADGVAVAEAAAVGEQSWGGEEAAGLSPLLRYAVALLPVGDIVNTTPDAGGQHTVTRQTANGGKASFTFDQNCPIPVRVILSDSYEILDLLVDLTA